MYFQNLHLPEIQKQIQHLCQGKSGVYKITNRDNQKSYVGRAITKQKNGNRLYNRFRNHFFHQDKQYPLKHAIKKYGICGFSWEILEFTEISDTRMRETWWIQKLQSQYNILETAENSLGYIQTQQTREKMKAGYSQARRLAIGQLNKGLPVSPEVRQKMSQAAGNRTPQQKQRHQEICRA